MTAKHPAKTSADLLDYLNVQSLDHLDTFVSITTTKARRPFSIQPCDAVSIKFFLLKTWSIFESYLKATVCSVLDRAGYYEQTLVFVQAKLNLGSLVCARSEMEKVLLRFCDCIVWDSDRSRDLIDWLDALQAECIWFKVKVYVWNMDLKWIMYFQLMMIKEWSGIVSSDVELNCSLKH